MLRTIASALIFGFVIATIVVVPVTIGAALLVAKPPTMVTPP
jgi:hypothetical protein